MQDYIPGHISFLKNPYILFCIILWGYGMCRVEVRGQLSGVDCRLPLGVLRIELRLSGLCRKHLYPLNHLDGPHVLLFSWGVLGLKLQALCLKSLGFTPSPRTLIMVLRQEFEGPKLSSELMSFLQFPKRARFTGKLHHSWLLNWCLVLWCWKSESRTLLYMLAKHTSQNCAPYP